MRCRQPHRGKRCALWGGRCSALRVGHAPGWDGHTGVGGRTLQALVGGRKRVTSAAAACASARCCPHLVVGSCSGMLVGRRSGTGVDAAFGGRRVCVLTSGGRRAAACAPCLLLSASSLGCCASPGMPERWRNSMQGTFVGRQLRRRHSRTPGCRRQVCTCASCSACSPIRCRKGTGRCTGRSHLR